MCAIFIIVQVNCKLIQCAFRFNSAVVSALRYVIINKDTLIPKFHDGCYSMDIVTYSQSDNSIRYLMNGDKYFLRGHVGSQTPEPKNQPG